MQRQLFRLFAQQAFSKSFKTFQKTQHYKFSTQIPLHTVVESDKDGLKVELLRNTQNNYFIQQFYTGCLAEAAYYIQSKGEVAIIDPLRDTAPYIELAKKEGAQIKYILMTHFHADFVSGHEDLAAKTGAKIIYGPTAQPSFEAYVAKDNESLQVGDVEIKVLHTPGHTQESSTFMLVDKNQPQAIFTGDTLFLGEVGRPDLAVKAGHITKEDLASWLYDSLYQKILPLPDSVLVYPGHGAGSPCGKAIQEGSYDLLGNQKKSNYALQFSTKDAFIASVTSGLPTPPSYFFHDVMMNKSGGSKDIDEIVTRNNTPLSVTEFQNCIQTQGYTVLDTRDHLIYLSGFVPNSYNVDLKQSFALWVGKLMTPEKKFVLICDEGKEREAIVRLCRIGYDNVKGYLKGGIKEWENAGNELKKVTLMSAEEFDKQVYQKQSDIQFVDVRNPSEQSSGYIEKSVNVPLWEMEEYLKKNNTVFNKEKPVYISCQKGARGVSAASILSSNGYEKLVNIDGGMNSIMKTSIPIVYK